MEKPLQVLILATGDCPWMSPPVPRAKLSLCEKILLEWVFEAVAGLAPTKVITITKPGWEENVQRFEDRPKWVVVSAAGDESALTLALNQLDSGPADILLLPVELPLLRPETLTRLGQEHRSAQTPMSCLASSQFPYPPEAQSSSSATSTGSYPRADKACLAAAPHGEVLVVDRAVLLRQAQGLPPALSTFSEVLKRLRATGMTFNLVTTTDPSELMPVYTLADLTAAAQVMRQRINTRWMQAGVNLLDPERTVIGPRVCLEPGVTIHAGVTLRGETAVAADCELLPGTYLENARLSRGVRVEFSVIRDSEVKAGTTVGPYAHIRGGTVIGPDNRIGNFVEFKKTVTGPHTKASHLAYLGDATIGADVNIGAGTITCNYDGLNKNPTLIEDGAFVGSDSIIVAPLRIGRGAWVAAGSTITEDVPPESLAIGRSRQTNIEGWAKKRVEEIAAAKKEPGEKH